MLKVVEQKTTWAYFYQLGEHLFRHRPNYIIAVAKKSELWPMYMAAQPVGVKAAI